MDKEKNTGETPEQNTPVPPDEKETPDLSHEQLEKLIQRYREAGGSEGGKIKTARVRIKRPSWKQLLLSLLVSYLVDLFLTVALSGYLGFAEHDWLSIVLFSLIFTTTEALLRMVVIRFVTKLFMMSFGMISIPITILSFVFATLVTPGLVIESTGRLILFFIIFMIIRLLFRIFMMRKSIINQLRVTKNY